MESFIHHIEWCVENLEETEKILSDKYGFKLISQRDIYHSSLAYSDRNIITVSQKVLQSGKTVFILTKNNCQKEGTIDVGQNASYPSFTCCSYEKEHKRDSVFNICLEVKDVDAVTKRIIEYDDEGETAIVTQPTNIYYGENCRLRFSVVRSKCGNIIHTLINTKGYRQAQNVPFHLSSDRLARKSFARQQRMLCKTPEFIQKAKRVIYSGPRRPRRCHSPGERKFRCR